ncbi:hypothetical protein ACHAWF_011969 [Thalassiosira exigua]
MASLSPASSPMTSSVNTSTSPDAPTMPGLWRHTWRPVQSVLIMGDFGIKYIGKQHVDPLLNLLKNH